jgi:predicted DCC family thiol-disulfide oxidoreductase YuxK
MQKDKDAMIVVYDGECPFCVNYVALMNLRNAIGLVTLVDARTEAAPVKEIVRLGYDLNEGMAVIFGGSVYYGEDAITFISSLTNSRNLAGRLLSRLLRSRERAAVLYPIMKLGRRVTLKVLGKSWPTPGSVDVGSS